MNRSKSEEVVYYIIKNLFFNTESRRHFINYSQREYQSSSILLCPDNNSNI